MTRATDRAAIAVDLGGTKIAVARIAGGEILAQRRIATPRTGRGDDIADAIAGAVAEIGGAPGPIGVATTGIVLGGRITALNPGTLPIEDRYGMAEALEARLGVAPLLLNDAQAAAWGEYRFGAGRGCATFAFLTISTGIGGGVVADGALQTGRQGLAGHVGHVTALREGPSCGCGRRGCLEAVASGSAIARLASAGRRVPMDAPAVFAAAAAGEAECGRLLDGAAALVASAIADLVATLDLERVVIGGGVGLAPGFLPRIAAALAGEPAPFRRPLVHAERGGDAGLIGVADWVWRNFSSHAQD